jgi:hypothetical protein
MTWNRTPSGTPPSSPPSTSASFDNLLQNLDLSLVTSEDESTHDITECIPIVHDRDNSNPLGTPPLERSIDEISYYSSTPPSSPDLGEHNFTALFDLPNY